MEKEVQQIKVTLQSDTGRKFLADVWLPKNAQNLPVVLFVHGFKGFKDWGHFNLVGQYFAQHGFAFAKFNFSHNGTTPESPLDLTDLEAFAENNFSKELSDLKTFTDFLTSAPAELPANALNPDQLFCIGHSRGGSVAILHAAEDARIKAVASWAAVSNFEDRWTEQQLTNWKTNGVEYVLNARTGQQLAMNYQIVEDFYANQLRFDILNAAEKLKNRLLIVHGEADESVPVQCARELKTANPQAELLVLPFCDHSFGGAHPFTAANLPKNALAAAEHTLTFFRKFAHG